MKEKKISAESIEKLRKFLDTVAKNIKQNDGKINRTELQKSFGIDSGKLTSAVDLGIFTMLGPNHYSTNFNEINYGVAESVIKFHNQKAKMVKIEKEKEAEKKKVHSASYEFKFEDLQKGVETTANDISKAVREFYEAEAKVDFMKELKDVQDIVSVKRQGEITPKEEYEKAAYETDTKSVDDFIDEFYNEDGDVTWIDNSDLTLPSEEDVELLIPLFKSLGLLSYKDQVYKAACVVNLFNNKGRNMTLTDIGNLIKQINECEFIKEVEREI